MHMTHMFEVVRIGEKHHRRLAADMASAVSIRTGTEPEGKQHYNILQL